MPDVLTVYPLQKAGETNEWAPEFIPESGVIYP